MDKFSLVYIDDNPDISLTKYLDEEFQNPNYDFDFTEIRFHPEEGYESLLTNQKVSSANIIFIDSMLFEHRTVTNTKFTGEEFKLILKKFYPFIEVIVITQNCIEPEIKKIAKYDKKFGDSPSEYYNSVLPRIIEEAVNNIKQYWKLADLFNKNEIWEDVLKNKVIATLKGIDTYDQLTKADIDDLILAFKEIQEALDG